MMRRDSAPAERKRDRLADALQGASLMLALAAVVCVVVSAFGVYLPFDPPIRVEATWAAGLAIGALAAYVLGSGEPTSNEPP